MSHEWSHENNELSAPVELLEIARRGQTTRSDKTAKSDFKDMFSAELAGNREVSFSKHASERLFSRGIELFR